MGISRDIGLNTIFLKQYVEKHKLNEIVDIIKFKNLSESLEKLNKTQVVMNYSNTRLNCCTFANGRYCIFHSRGIICIVLRNGSRI